MSRGFASNYRAVLLATALVGCFVAVGVRLVYLHVIDREDLLRNIVKTRRQEMREPARRGDILDTNGRPLALSRPVRTVAVDPMLVDESDEAKLPRLAELLGIPLTDVRRAFFTRFRPVPAAAPKLAPKPVAASARGEGTAPSGTGLLKVNFLRNGDDSDPRGADLPTLEFMRAILAANAEEAPENDVSTATTEESGDIEDAETDGPRMRPIRWAKLRDDVSESTYAEIEKLKIRALCPPERRFARYYPHDELAAHIIGYANRENHGAAGVEAFADFYLRGRDGWREGEKDGRRRELAQFQTRNIPKADGYQVVLTIDARVQDIVETELDTIAKTYLPKKATIIVSDPRTGFILGLGNYPTFNPNEYNLVPRNEMARMKNIAVTDSFEPGSVFKIVAASAALEERLVGVETRFNCSNEILTFPWRNGRVVDVRLGEDHRFDHPLTVAEIVSKSSNRGAAQLAIMLGDERFDRYARAFGFGQTLGFPVGGEVAGIYKPREQWVATDFTRMAMGHAIASTAIQMHQAMCVVANGGVLLRPQVVREIRDSSGGTVYRYDRSEIRRVISDRTARTMAGLLQRVASPEGTASGVAIQIGDVDYQVAGKTGTAQKYVKRVLPNGKERIEVSRRNHVVSFVGFFPASRPQVAISVIVDDADHRCPGGVAYGSSVAGPVFKRIGEKLIPILSITAPNHSAPIDRFAATAGGRP